MGLKAGARGAIDLPVLACLPWAVGGVPWQDAQDHSPPWRVVKNSLPLSALPGLPACALQCASCWAAVVSAAWLGLAAAQRHSAARARVRTVVIVVSL
ncbi:hypothetical protein D3C72_2139330 [compost metagenome]